jgi:Phosphotransferase enzyme family
VVTDARLHPRAATPAHERYRERLAALADQELVSLAAASVLERGAGEHLVQRYARFRPDHEPYSTLVLETDPAGEIVCMDAFESRPAALDGAVAIAAGVAGWLLVRPLGFDPGLPTLPEVLAGPGRRTVVRYRPSSRCTVRVEDEGEVRYARVVASGGKRLQRKSVRVWRAWQDDRLGFFVPRPLGYDPRLRAVWQGELAGEDIRSELYGDDGAALARRVGRAAASIPASRLAPDSVFDEGARFIESTRLCQEVRRTLPPLAPMLDELLGRLWTVHVTAPERALRPIHGDLYPPQWLRSEHGLGLVDFERLALGHPELDAATFVAGIDGDRGRTEVSEAFVAGYEEVAEPLDRQWLAAYRAHVRLRKVVKAVRAIRPDGDQRAERHLRDILDQLEGEIL